MNRYMILILGIAGLILISTATGIRAEDGLVAHYTFSEGSGTVLHDRSGNGLDGKILGSAEWIKTSTGSALKFNGTDTYIDCGNTADFGAGDAGTIEMWLNMEAYQGGFLSRSTGNGWADQRLVIAIMTYGGSDVLINCLADGVHNWYKFFAKKPPLGEWTHFALTFDQANVTMYMNGKKIDSAPKDFAPGVQGTPLRIGYCEGLGDSYFKGVMDEVRLYNRALSARDIAIRFGERASAKGFSSIPLGTEPEEAKITVDPSVLADREQVMVEADLSAQWPIPEGSSLLLALRAPGQNQAIREIVVSPDSPSVSACFNMLAIAPGDYEITMAVKNDKGVVTGKTLVEKFHWSGPSPEFASGSGVKVLNNMVMELLNTRTVEGEQFSEYSFTNPYDGWVYVASTASTGDKGSVQVSIDDDPKLREILVHTPNSSDKLEAMRLLLKGRHTISIRCDGQPLSAEIVVRAIPELVYCQYPENPLVTDHGPYDWDFLKKYVLPHSNCIVSNATTLDIPEHKANAEEWKNQGKRWIVHAGVPGLNAASIDQAYEYWHGQRGFQDEMLDGLIIDEFSGASGSGNHLEWAKVVNRIYQDPNVKNKVFYPFTGGLPFYEGETSKVFAEAVIRNGGAIAPEYYISEKPTLADADASFLPLRDEAMGWAKMYPNGARHLLPAPGYMSAPPEGLNIDPSVDFKVFLDRYMYQMANDPAFFKLYGVLFYKSGYADEETVRWAAALCRHYGIEGKSSMLSEELGYKYKLDHVMNPDFDEGVKGWTISPAEDGSMTTGHFNGWSWLQGRYPSTSRGDNFLLTRRSATGPNTFTQEIKNLVPGRLYSMKMITGDHQELLSEKSTEQKYAVSIKLDGVELLSDKCFDQIAGSMHTVGKFVYPSNRMWMNYHWRVFRATGSTARLSVSDWAADGNPGGAIGQELIYNFIEVQPYYPD